MSNRSLKKLVAIGIAVAGISIAAASPASADYAGIRPTFKTQDVWFHCNGQTKVHQVNFLMDQAYVPWSSAPPSGSVRDGAGCGGADNGWITFDVYDVAFEGTFVGNLRNLTVRIHELIFNQTRQTDSQQMRVYAEIDGTPVFPGGSAETGGYTGRTFTVTPTPENSGVTALFEFSIWNLGFANEIRDAQGNLIDVERGGVALEDGDGTEEHSLKLYIGIDSLVGQEQPGDTDFFVWDTTEVPSGITFNPTELAPDTVKADLPNFSQA